MTTAAHAAILSTVSGLSDSRLLEQTGKLATLDHQIQVFVIDHLLEIEARKLYLTAGSRVCSTTSRTGWATATPPRGGGSTP